MAACRYATDGRVLLGVRDAFWPNNDGTYAVEVSGGESSCALTDGTPDVECSLAGLGSTYLGGITWGALAAAGRATERTPGALDVLGAMFRADVAPWPMFYFSEVFSPGALGP